jgi:hypothetical protein
MTKFLEMFTPIQKGNFGLTDEAIYKTIQQGGQFIPVYGGTKQHTTTDRFVSNRGKTKYEQPITVFEGDGIIVSLDGSAGCMTHTPSRKFALNHHAGFYRVRSDAKDVIIPEFFSLFFQKQLQEESISEGSKTLGIRTIKAIDFAVPSLPVQQDVMALITPVLRIRQALTDLLTRIDSVKGRVPSVDYGDYQARNVAVSVLLDCHSGNSGLTEQEIYRRILLEGQRYKVLSGSTSVETQLGSVPKGQLNGRELKVLQGQDGLLVVRKGKAGIIEYYPKGNYTLTDDAYFLTVKKDCRYEVDLKWLAAQYQHIFLSYSSSSDNGTWNKTQFFRNARIDVPKYREQLDLAEKYDQLWAMELRVKEILARIATLFAKQVVGSDF